MTSTRVADFRLDDWLPSGVTPEDVIVGAAGLAALLLVLAVWSTFTGDNPFERRFAHITQGKEDLRRKALAATPRKQRTSPVGGAMRSLVTRLNLLRSQQAGQARAMLVHAGVRSQDAMIKYLFAQLTLPFLFGALVLLNGYVVHIVPIPEQYTMLAATGAVVAGFYAPRTYLKNMATRRAQLLELGLPDGLDLLVICAEAGLSLDAALNRVARELGSTWPELSEELAITAAELTFMPDRNQAFENLNYRTDLDSIRGVVNTLQQTLKFGTPLARSLRVLGAEFRQQRMTKAESKAARLPAMLTVPMIVFILPCLFIVMLGPAALGVIDVFSGKPPEGATAVATGTGAGAAGAPAGGGPATVAAASSAAPGETGSDALPQAASDVGSGGGAAASSAAVSTKVAEKLPDPKAAVVPTTIRAGSGEPIVVDIDARPLRTGSNQRLVVVPAGTPDTIDPATLPQASTPVLPVQTRVSLAPAGPGLNEVRLYDIPQSGTHYTIAARATIQVAGASGTAAKPPR